MPGDQDRVTGTGRPPGSPLLWTGLESRFIRSIVVALSRSVGAHRFAG